MKIADVVTYLLTFSGLGIILGGFFYLFTQNFQVPMTVGALMVMSSALLRFFYLIPVKFRSRGAIKAWKIAWKTNDLPKGVRHE